jgi:hypothetical protein
MERHLVRPLEAAGDRELSAPGDQLLDETLGMPVAAQTPRGGEQQRPTVPGTDQQIVIIEDVADERGHGAGVLLDLGQPALQQVGIRWDNGSFFPAPHGSMAKHANGSCRRTRRL